MDTAGHDDTVRTSFTAQTRLFTGADAVFARREARTPWLDPMHHDMIVLDVACGAGHLAEDAAPHVRQVVGVDLTSPLLQMGADRIRAAGLTNVLLMEGNAARLPFADQSFDLVVCRAALHHFPRPQGPLAEMARVCRPGGRVAVNDMVAPDAEVREAFDALHRALDPSHVRALLADELDALVRSAVGAQAVTDLGDPRYLPLDRILTEVADRPAVLTTLHAELAGGPPTGFAPRADGAQLNVQFRTATVQAIRG
jgi:ubiquinone/menaquinone biosynthesis C-methylase UbiE